MAKEAAFIMPQIANLTVKKNDGTTDVTFTAVAPSGGDKSPAIWQNLAVGTAMAHRPTLKLTAKASGDGKVRRSDFIFTYPSTVVDTNGRTSVAGTTVLTGSFATPQDLSSTDVNEAVAQGFNCLATALIKSCVQVGYSAT